MYTCSANRQPSWRIDIRHFFLESPLLLAPVLVVGLYALLVVWLRRRTDRSKRALLVGLVVAIALLCVQHFVVTDQERLRAVCAKLVDATEQGDVDAIARHVSKRFAVRDLDRAAFLEAAERTLTTYAVEDPSARVAKVDVADNKATVELRVSCTVVAQDVGRFLIPTAWSIKFEKEDGVWRMTAVDPIPTSLFNYRRIEEIVR